MKSSQQTSASKTVSKLTLIFLVACAAATVYNARRDPLNFGFVVFIYATHAALLACKWWWEKREAAGEGAEGIKAAVWGLATALSAGVVCWMAATLPTREAVWVLVVFLSVVIGGLLGLMLYGLPAEVGDEKKKV